jgi:hypothetical protein
MKTRRTKTAGLRLANELDRINNEVDDAIALLASLQLATECSRAAMAARAIR